MTIRTLAAAATGLIVLCGTGAVDLQAHNAR